MEMEIEMEEVWWRWTRPLYSFSLSVIVIISKKKELHKRSSFFFLLLILRRTDAKVFSEFFRTLLKDLHSS